MTTLAEHSVETAVPNQDSAVLEMLENKWAEGKFLCVGLDVSGEEGQHGPLDLYEKAKLIVDSTHDVAAAYKPNSAFYEDRASSGIAQLEQLVGYIKQLAPDIPVIWDSKRADIAKTNEGYAHAEANLGFDSMTIHPYLGGSAVKPILSDPDRLGIVLAHTSNPGAGELQHLQLRSGELLWERVVSNVAHNPDWQHGSPLGIVVGATYPEELAKARYLAGDNIVMLVPGVGTQGGDLEAAVRGAMNSRGNGFVINVSSGISGAKDAEGKVTAESIRDAAIKFHEQIKSVWDEALRNPQPSYGERALVEFDSRLASALFEEQCIKFGDFVLRNGKRSPIYVDLRDSVTNPELRGNIAQIYVDLVKGLEERRGEPFDLLSAVPQASTSYGAIVAERLNRRLIQPRDGSKAHGVSKSIMGRYMPGETVGVIDDLITDGGAKLDTIRTLEAEGLVFGGTALLVDREQGGFREMAARGNPILTSTTLRKLVQALDDQHKVPAEYRDTVLDYVK